MKYNITQKDKDLLLQTSLDYKYKLIVLNRDGAILDELECIESVGTYNIDSESNIRRTTNIILYLDGTYDSMSIERKIYDWIGLNFGLQIGIQSMRTNEHVWFKCGNYLITSGGTNYNATTNSISLSLSDNYANLDGTRNGQVGGAPTIEIPNVDDKGNIITIKQTVEGILKSETNIKKYIIDDIGQFYGMPQNNPDYVEYRKNNPKWNQLPYDLKYEASCTLGSIFSEISELYPNCQMYFDVYNNFCFNLIPSCEYDPVILDNDYIQEILLSDDSENVTYDIQNIKNITEIFGAIYEVDRTSTSCTLSTNIYTIALDKYEGYSSGDMIAFTPNATNIANTKIRINSLEAIPLYNEYTTTYINSSVLEKDKMYVIQIKRVNGSFLAYFLGQYQPHALCVLTDDINDKTYTKSYFAKKYNCDERNITLRVEKNSPFTVQRLGEILDVKTGDEFENILSDSVAVENAIYYNRKSTSMNDTVTITTKMIPFLDVNQKVEYRKQQETKTHQYIINSISNDTDSYVTHITMYRFYPLYYK